ncbi:MAG: sigma-54-dependent Fis family transcriptional regulator [bacterium]|nr:sigma-54-dependent Fis family transcriptional regulator [bacterium]
MKKLLKWCARGEIYHHGTKAPLKNPMLLVVPAGIKRDIIIGPLGAPERYRGFLALIARQNHIFTLRHRALAQTLLDPFSVAQENDSRLHELAVLREAAEADKRSLLRRLGRKELADNIVGSDSGLHLVMERVEQVAHLNVPVLILGETGSGKELIARAIHKRSHCSTGAFIRVNCGAIPAELIDSQLFGHERGAFTGATETRKGWFERADGGTLFLDEIGDLPAAAQVRLLRILQDGWLERVGSQKSTHVDVRVVAATHCDLAANVTEKKFREDLWYRISTFPIRLPSLRERPQDIPNLARHFAEHAATRFGLRCVMPTQDQINLLLSYNWPGNVREISSVIDRAAILGNGTKLEVEKALGIMENPIPLTLDNTKIKFEKLIASANNMSLERSIKKHIEAALELTRGRIEGPDGAAILLSINPNTLRAKMRKLKINWRQFHTNTKELA